MLRHSCAQCSRMVTGREGAGGRNGCYMLRGRDRVHPEDGKGQGRPRLLELDPIWGRQRTHDATDHGLQSLQKWESQFRHIVPTAIPTFHHEKTGPNVSANTLPATSRGRHNEMEGRRGEDNPVCGSQRACLRWNARQSAQQQGTSGRWEGTRKA